MISVSPGATKPTTSCSTGPPATNYVIDPDGMFHRSIDHQLCLAVRGKTVNCRDVKTGIVRITYVADQDDFCVRRVDFPLVFTAQCYTQRSLFCRNMSVRLSGTCRYSIETAQYVTRLFRRRVATLFLFFFTTQYGNTSTEIPLIGSSHSGGYLKNRDFRAV